MTCIVCRFHDSVFTHHCPRCHTPRDGRRVETEGENDDRVSFELPPRADDTDTAQPLTLPSDTAL